MVRSINRRHLLRLFAGTISTPAGLGAAGAQEIPSPGANVVLDLTDDTGRIVRAIDLKGKWALIFFGYTSCPDICPTTLFDIAQVLQLLDEAAENVAAIFISVDPERDDAKRLREYVGSFDRRILSLSGSPEQIKQSAQSFGVSYFRIAGSAPETYTIAHSAFISLVGPEGGVVTRFSTDNTPDQIATRLKNLF